MKQVKGSDNLNIKLYQHNLRAYWDALRMQPVSFWAISLCIMNEFLRIQGLFSVLNNLPISKSLFFLAVISWFANSKEKYLKDNFLWLLVVMFIVIIISSMNAYNSQVSFDRLEIYINWLVFYFLVVQSVNNETRLLLFIWFVLLPILKMSLFGAKTWALRGFAFTEWGIAGPQGYFQNSGELSLLMVMFFAMTVGMYIGFREHLSKTKKLLFLLMPVTAIMTTLASATRGSQLALLIVIMVFSIFYKKVNLKTIVLTAATLFLSYTLLPDEQKMRFDSAGDDKTSKARITYWTKGYEMLKDHPLTGVGYFNFPYYFDYQYPEFKLYDKKERAHNHVVEIASTLGYPGFILYMLIMFGCYKASQRTRKALDKYNLKQHWIYSFTVGMDCALIGYFIGAMFMSVAFYPYIWIHAALIIAIYNVGKNIVRNDIKGLSVK